MGKKCVRSTTFVCLAAAIVMIGAMTSITTAQSGDPTTLPLLTADGVAYVGGFRLPAQSVNGDSFSNGGKPVAFNPAGNSLFIGSRAGRIAEVSIPSPVSSSNVNDLPFASFLQPFADPTEGHLGQVANDGVAIDGLLVYGNRLHGTATIYYDANNTQRLTHYSRSLQLNQASFSGWSSVWEAGKSGFVSGMMALVPEEWQTLLGGSAITGQCCIPIAWRTSWGPAAFSFNPGHVGQASVAAHPLVYYTGEHHTLGHWDGATPTYGATIQIGGVAIIKGTRTAIYVGRNGTGANCYGNGTSNQSLHGTYGPDGALWCYDPTTSDKGSHAYPYRYQIWAYDLNDFAAVKAGQKQPWEVVPYAVWPFDLPTPEPAVRLGGIGYDPERQLLYVSQMGADKDGYSYRPVMHALQIDLAGAPITTPVNDPPPPSAPAPPAPPAIVSAVAIDANKVAPQVAGTTTTFTASPTGGVAPHQFKWMVYDGSAWTMGAWTSSNQFAWSPTSANTAYRIGVWVRSAGNAADTAELSIAMPFAITAPAATAPLTAVTLSSDRVAPQPAGTAVAWTASPVGGAGPHQYKWLLFDGASWTTIGNWSTSATLAWTPATANSSYRVGVWVRSFGRSNDAAEAATSSAFAVSSTTSTPPSSAPTANVSAVALSANRVAPQPAGTPVIWTAAPVGGSAHEYKWLLFDGATWTTIGNWSATATLAWTPASANSAYRIGVWVRAAGNGNDAAEAANSTPFAVSSGATAAPAAPVSTATVSAVVLSANRAAPQPAGTAVTWTAVPAGSGAMLYRWWLFDGANWTPSGTWTTANTFTWVPATANAGYRVGVWTKRAANAGDISEASASEPFAIAAGAVVATHTTASTASDSTSGPATAVELSANAVAPVLVGSTVTWTATPIGGAGQHQYKWLLFTGITWVELTGWTDSSSYSWSPVAPGTGYRIGVWVRSAGRTANAAEAAVSVGFPVSG